MPKGHGVGKQMSLRQAQGPQKVTLQGRFLGFSLGPQTQGRNDVEKYQLDIAAVICHNYEGRYLFKRPVKEKKMDHVVNHATKFALELALASALRLRLSQG
ncbi:MAG: hypothetical protein GX629_04025 [Phycisphaerae bacterium]|nr:hypothetical protein [Phycisphaerae bacterium]